MNLQQSYHCQNCGSEFKKGMFVSLRVSKFYEIEQETYCFQCNNLINKIKDLEHKLEQYRSKITYLNRLCLKKNIKQYYKENGFKRSDCEESSASSSDEREDICEHFEEFARKLLRKRSKDGNGSI